MNSPFVSPPKKALEASDLQVHDHHSNYRAAKEVYLHRKTNRQNAKSVSLIITGILLAGFGLKSFLLPSKFIDGGATGISLLLSGVTQYPLSMFIVIVNLPFILLGYKQIGKVFAIKTICAIFGLALCLALVEYPTV